MTTTERTPCFEGDRTLVNHNRMLLVLQHIRNQLEACLRIADNDKRTLLEETILTEDLISFIEQHAERFPGPGDESIQAGLFVSYSHGFNDCAEMVLRAVKQLGDLV